VKLSPSDDAAVSDDAISVRHATSGVAKGANKSREANVADNKNDLADLAAIIKPRPPMYVEIREQTLWLIVEKKSYVH
jgi:hypothetical protein